MKKQITLTLGLVIAIAFTTLNGFAANLDKSNVKSPKTKSIQTDNFASADLQQSMNAAMDAIQEDMGKMDESLASADAAERKRAEDVLQTGIVH